MRSALDNQFVWGPILESIRSSGATNESRGNNTNKNQRTSGRLTDKNQKNSKNSMKKPQETKSEKPKKQKKDKSHKASRSKVLAEILVVLRKLIQFS
ncbi:unnamed protein product [Rhizophagus irregularis]|uniref:Uncharacterized protein n=1 Tax=Rhizophagus irregularis TaxID=588596 RepID=A0A915ZGE8_9GLOM|nr:unnamed protein product [Rhizophagus irregularis]CAB5179705.1 unnamed protein product [Rhizophagus irregularis]CAB5375609.1 unnamed protein product [Rhizophagus irregularis]